MQNRVFARPERALRFTELPRAASDLGALLSVGPFLSLAPRGDGHTVLVLPGFGAGDRSTTVLRGYLTRQGLQAEPWQLGRNLGPAMADLPAALARRLDQLFTESGAKVSLVGWSLGGVYARLLAQQYPQKVRQVITLGSPFGGHPASTSVYPVAERLGINVGRSPTDTYRELASRPLPGIPNTALFSKSDGIVPWRIASQEPTALAENIEVYASHLGLGVSPAVLYAVADRLAQKEGQWHKFERRGWKVAVYGPAHLDDVNPSQVA